MKKRKLIAAVSLVILLIVCVFLLRIYASGPVTIHVMNATEITLTNVLVSEDRSGKKVLVKTIDPNSFATVTMESDAEQDYRVKGKLADRLLESYPLYTEGRECINFEFHNNEVKDSLRGAKDNC